MITQMFTSFLSKSDGAPLDCCFKVIVFIYQVSVDQTSATGKEVATSVMKEKTRVDGFATANPPSTKIPTPTKKYSVQSTETGKTPCSISVFIHGYAADRVSKKISERGMIASDLLHEIAIILSEYDK